MAKWLLGTFLLLATACATAGSGTGGAPTNRDLIVAEEIQESAASNAYEVVQSLRSQWLRTRGTQSFREQGQIATTEGGGAVAVPGRATIIVYLDDAYLGAVETLRQVPLASVQYIQRFDAAAANYRWGAGHSHGVIFVSTQALSRR